MGCDVMRCDEMVVPVLCLPTAPPTARFRFIFLFVCCTLCLFVVAAARKAQPRSENLRPPGVGFCIRYGQYGGGRGGFCAVEGVHML